MNNELFCNQNISLKLNELGFNEYCFAYFSLDSFSYPIDKYGILSSIEVGDLITENDMKYFECIKKNFKFLNAPTLEQAKDWLLKNYGFYVDVISAFSGKFDSNDKMLHFWKPSIEKISFKDDNLFSIDDRMIYLFTDVETSSRYDAYIKAFEKVMEMIENMKK